MQPILIYTFDDASTSERRTLQLRWPAQGAWAVPLASRTASRTAAIPSERAAWRVSRRVGRDDGFAVVPLPPPLPLPLPGSHACPRAAACRDGKKLRQDASLEDVYELGAVLGEGGGCWWAKGRGRAGNR